MKTELNKNENLSTEQEAPPIANLLLYAVYSTEFDKWEKEYNPSNYFIDGGRTIPYDFHYFCSKMWGEMIHQRGTTFEMFREQMLNSAMNWQKSLKDALWNVVENFNINSV